MMDASHDPNAVSWVESANTHADFPIQNLPLGVFSEGFSTPRIGTAIGDFILDLGAVSALLDLPGEVGEGIRLALSGSTLNMLFELPKPARQALRLAVFAILSDANRRADVEPSLFAADKCTLHIPVAVRNFTDFFAGIHHARTVGSLLRPENPLLPNYKYVPVAYHSRASTVAVSGGAVIRPSGQVKPPDGTVPVVNPCRRLDYEVELGIWVSGRSQIGDPIPVSEAREHVAGFCLLNDWSARDIQAWEYQPLGPFLAKSFATTISPWVVTAEALEPFRRPQAPRPEGDPAPLPYLFDAEDQESGVYDISIDIELLSADMRKNNAAPFRLGSTSSVNLYWTIAQMIAHHTINGCDLAAGDLLGSGTISGPDDSSRGSLMELSMGGKNPIELPNGESRTFLEDGDEVILKGWVERAGYRRIGLGTCSAIIAARASRGG